MYLKNVKGEPSYYAAPARCKDYRGLPPAYTFVGDIEPFYAETMSFVRKLQEAGVEVNVDVYEDWWHAYDLLRPFEDKSKVAIRRFSKRFAYAMEHYHAPNED